MWCEPAGKGQGLGRRQTGVACCPSRGRGCQGCLQAGGRPHCGAAVIGVVQRLVPGTDRLRAADRHWKHRRRCSSSG